MKAQFSCTPDLLKTFLHSRIFWTHLWVIYKETNSGCSNVEIHPKLFQTLIFRLKQLKKQTNNKNKKQKLIQILGGWWEKM